MIMTKMENPDLILEIPLYVVKPSSSNLTTHNYGGIL